MIIEWIKRTFFGKNSERTKTKNAILLGAWDEYQKKPFPDFNTTSNKLSHMICDLTLRDDYIAGYIHTYIFYGRYDDERKDFDLRYGIKSEVDSLIKFLSDFKKIKLPIGAEPRGIRLE